MSRSQRTLLTVLVIALLGVLAVSVFHDDDEASTSTSAALAGSAGPEVVTAAQLADFVAASGETTYWIGPRRGASYELTASAGGPIYVRYLRDGAEAGDPRPDFVTVATYPERDGAAELRQAARGQPGAELSRTPGGGLLLIDPASPKSAYVAYPDANVQVELFSPIPDHARRLASRDEVEQVR